MTTAEHILRWITPSRERRNVCDLRAKCSCGGIKWRDIPDESTVRELHGRHVQEASDKEQEERDALES